MANTTKNLIRTPVGKDGRTAHVGVDGGTHLYEAAMVSQLAATGMLVAATTALSGPVVGVSEFEVDNSSGADGDKECAVEFDREFVFDNATAGDACAATTPLGSAVYASDDHTIANNSNNGARPFAGFFRGLEPDGRVRVLIPSGSLVQAQAADVGALNLAALAGTANTTLEAIPDPADAPATADALRDDLVANALPKIRNNLADVGTQVNAIRTALRNAGLMA